MTLFDNNRELFDIPTWDDIVDWDRTNFILNYGSASGPFQSSRTFLDMDMVGAGFPNVVYHYPDHNSCESEEIDLWWSSNPAGDEPNFGDEFDYITAGSTSVNWGEEFSHYFEIINNPGFPWGGWSTGGDGPTLSWSQVYQINDTVYFGQCSGDRLALTKVYWYDTPAFAANRPGRLRWSFITTNNSPLLGNEIRKSETFAEVFASEWKMYIDFIGTAANTVTMNLYADDGIAGPVLWDQVIGAVVPNSGLPYILGIYLHHDELWFMYGPPGAVIQRHVFGAGMGVGRWTDRLALYPGGEMPYYGTMSWWGEDCASAVVVMHLN